MSDAPPPPRPPSPRLALPAVAGMLAGMAAGKAADAAVLPSLGWWGALAVGMVTAAGVAALVGLPLYYWLFRRG